MISLRRLVALGALIAMLQPAVPAGADSPTAITGVALGQSLPSLFPPSFYPHVASLAVDLDTTRSPMGTVRYVWASNYNGVTDAAFTADCVSVTHHQPSGGTAWYASGIEEGTRVHLDLLIHPEYALVGISETAVDAPCRTYFWQGTYFQWWAENTR